MIMMDYKKMNQPGYILDRLNEIKAEDNKANYDADDGNGDIHFLY